MRSLLPQRKMLPAASVGEFPCAAQTRLCSSSKYSRKLQIHIPRHQKIANPNAAAPSCRSNKFTADNPYPTPTTNAPNGVGSPGRTGSAFSLGVKHNYAATTKKAEPLLRSDAHDEKVTCPPLAQPMRNSPPPLTPPAQT